MKITTPSSCSLTLVEDHEALLRRFCHYRDALDYCLATLKHHHMTKRGIAALVAKTEAIKSRANDQAETSECSGDSSLASCSVCVHGHDLDPREGSMVVCTPQHKAHDPNYCCTGFRRITLAEIDEITKARFGTPNAEAESSDGSEE